MDILVNDELKRNPTYNVHKMKLFVCLGFNRNEISDLVIKCLMRAMSGTFNSVRVSWVISSSPTAQDSNEGTFPKLTSPLLIYSVRCVCVCVCNVTYTGLTARHLSKRT